jgi:hypothetical protein
VDLATYIVNWTRPGRQEHAHRCALYDTYYDVYRAKVTPGENVEPWQSKLRVRYAMQIIDTALVNVVNGRPRAKVLPRGPEDEKAARSLQSALDYAVQADHLVEKEPLFVQQALIYGVTAAKNRWIVEKTEKLVRREIIQTDGSRLLVAQQEEVLTRDGPTFEPWSVYDIWWDPDARDVDSAEYVVLRSYASKDELRRLAYNETDGSGVYHNVEELIALGTVSPADSTAQQRFNQSEKRKDKYELWEVWRKTRSGLKVTVIGNQQIVLRDTPWNFLNGSKPIVITSCRPDLFDMQGISEIELVDHIQQALHTIQNMRMDNLHLTVMRGITYREGGVTDPNAMELRPRFKWPVGDHDDIKFQAPPPLPREAYDEQSTLLSQMQLITGINPYISGSGMDTVDQNTATGVTVLSEVASRLLRFKAKMILEKGFQRTYEQWAAMIQQLQDKPFWTRVIGEDGEAVWMEISPEDLGGNIDVIVEGSEESLSRQQERGEAVALLNAFAPFAGSVDISPVLERVGRAYNMPDLAKVMRPAPPPQPPGAPAAPAAPAVAPEPDTMPAGAQFPNRVADAIMGGGA